MARIDFDIDNFSGNNCRGARYDVYANGELVYHDISDCEVDAVCDDMARKPYLYCNINVVEL